MTSPVPENYVRRLLDRFEALGDAEALVATDGRRFSYTELRARTRDTAAWLWHQGVRPGMTICMLVSNPAESFFAQLGAHLLGCRTAFMMRTSPVGLIRSTLAAVEADVFIYEMKTSAEPGGEIAQAAAPMPVFCIGQGGLGPDLTDPPHVDELPFDPESVPFAPETLFQTSGTTGASKLVRHGERFFTAIQKVQEFYRPDDGRPIRHLSVSGTWHSAGQSAALMTWGSGGTLVMTFNVEPETYLTTVERERCTSTMMSPPMLYSLLDDERIASTDLSSLYSLTLGASPASPARLLQASKIFGKALNVVYGMGELPIITAQFPVGLDTTRPERLRSAGTPWGDARVEIRASDGTMLSTGEIGEIWVASELMTEGYYGATELSQQAIVDGWLRTGDVGRFDADGYLYVLDRVNDMINRGGDKVYCRPVEDTIAEHPDVRQVAVVGIPDETEGETVFAYVAVQPGATATPEELIQFTMDHLNETWAPVGIEIIDELPLTEFGKVDKKVLRARYFATAPARAAAAG
jgi:acyl-CoA synthetase (AMP-forming)/AMP-acid ligase II